MRAFLAIILLALVLPGHASPSTDDLAAYRARLLVYAGLKQPAEQIAVSLGNWFGRQRQANDDPYFQVRYNADGTVDIVYVEGDGDTIRFIANLARLRPVYEVVE